MCIRDRYKADNFEDAVAKAEKLVADGGYGHTSSLYADEVNAKDKITEFQNRMKTCRVLLNTPSSQGGIGDLYNFAIAPSLTLGCGSWGGNSVSENVGVKMCIRDRGTTEENCKVQYENGVGTITIDTASGEIVKADYHMLAAVTAVSYTHLFVHQFLCRFLQQE